MVDQATAAQRNTWTTDNADRVLFGGATGNLVAGNWASSAANITSAMTLSAAALNKAKRLAKKANPRIRPYKLKNSREYFVVFVGSNCFRDLQNDSTISMTPNCRAQVPNGSQVSHSASVSGRWTLKTVRLRGWGSSRFVNWVSTPVLS